MPFSIGTSPRLSYNEIHVITHLAFAVERPDFVSVNGRKDVKYYWKEVQEYLAGLELTARGIW